MRSSGSKLTGRVDSIHSEAPVENGLPTKEEEDLVYEGDVRHLAARVVEDVVKRASRAAKNKDCSLQKLPTIQIDSAPSLPSSPVDDEGEEPIDAEQVDIGWNTETQQDDEELRASLKLYVDDLLSQAMVIAQKKLQFVGLAEEDESDEEQLYTESSTAPAPPTPDRSDEEEEEDEEALAHEAAERVVEEVIAKATELVAERLEMLASLEFPITFDQAPEDIKEAATHFIKELVGKAIAMAEEKSIPTVPFNFEDVDLMKASNPWYIRAREALVRLLRTACFCTPRRQDS